MRFQNLCQDQAVKENSKYLLQMCCEDAFQMRVIVIID